MNEFIRFADKFHRFTLHYIALTHRSVVHSQTYHPQRPFCSSGGGRGVSRSLGRTPIVVVSSCLHAWAIKAEEQRIRYRREKERVDEWGGGIRYTEEGRERWGMGE